MFTVFGMAKIATVDTFKIGMFPRLGKHKGPYFKAYRGDGKTESASILIDSLEIVFLIGIKESELAEVLKWAKTNQKKLQDNWDRMISGQSLYPIVSALISPPGLEKVEPLPDLILEATFVDGTVKQIDFKKIDLIGILKPLQNESFFKQVKMVEGFPTWPNGLDLDPDELWEVGLEIKKTAASAN